jgi:hypothetical protein
MSVKQLFQPLPKSPRDLNIFFESEIRPILNVLREARGSVVDTPKDHLLGGLAQWLLEQGVSLDGLRLEQNAGREQKLMGSGVFASKDFHVRLLMLCRALLASYTTHAFD